MIDYFFKFSTEAVAIADAAGTIYYSGGQWNPDRVVPNLQIWRASQDVGNVHTFLTGWYGVISLDHIDNNLVNHAALQLAIDREKSKAGQVAIIRSNVGVVLNDLRFQPVFAGANYPVGALI